MYKTLDGLLHKAELEQRFLFLSMPWLKVTEVGRAMVMLPERVFMAVTRKRFMTT